MNLTEQQCLPGVEVMCINNAYKSQLMPSCYSSWIRVGHVYTIREKFFSLVNNKLSIKLNEIMGKRDPVYSREYGFHASRFKLLDPKDIQVFYDLIEQTADKKVLEPA